MSSLRAGDERLHHHDGSHDWDGGPADEHGQRAHQSALQAHLADHQAGADMTKEAQALHARRLTRIAIAGGRR